MIRLYNDNPGETLNVWGHSWAIKVRSAMRDLIKQADAENVSVRDLTTMVVDEITLCSSESRIEKVRKLHRERMEANNTSP